MRPIKEIEKDIKHATDNVKQCMKDKNYRVVDKDGQAYGLVHWATRLQEYWDERTELLDSHFGKGNYIEAK